MKKNLRSQFSNFRATRVLMLAILFTMFLSGLTFAAPTAMNVSASARVGITGVVKDAKGLPLPGVTVKIKGTNAGTSTDMDGKFHLNLPTGRETLVLTFVGFKTKEVAVGGKTVLDIVLEDDSKALEEVVVVGYGVQKKAHLTGAISQIKTSEVEDLPAGNIATAIAGRVLGVGVSGGASRPGSPATITVRQPVGASKDGGTSEPLYVIDDIVQIGGNGQPDATLFNSLDPSEIESISVLKDASAAIYGSRAANGVVLVRTKRGKSGKPVISYSGSFAINDATYMPKMMNAYQFGQYINIMNGPNGRLPNVGSEPYRYYFSQDELDYYQNNNINYNRLEDAWQSSFTTRHTLNVTGGSEKATYFGNVSYYKQNGNLATLDFNRWNFRSGTDVNLSKSIKVGLSLSGNNGNQEKTFNKIGGESDNNDWLTLVQTPSYLPSYINGLPAKVRGNTDAIGNYHFDEIQKLGNLATTDTKTFTVNAYLEYDVPYVKGLKAKAAVGRNLNSSRGSQIGTRYTLYQFQGDGQNYHIYNENSKVIATNNVENGNRLYYSNSNATSTQLNFNLSYNRQIGKHNIAGLFAVERSESESSQEDVWKANPSLTTNGQFGTANGVVDGRTFATEAGSLSYIGRINYNYNEKYLGEFLFRTDASTKFAPENYWGRFYSGSAGWVISKEDFWDSKTINFLKVRYSFGLLGNDQTKPWQWRQRYTYQDGKGAVFGTEAGSLVTTGQKMEASPNRNATWSSEFKNNLGIDASFLAGRLSTTVEGYYNHAYNILTQRIGSVPLTVGGTVAAENYGIINSFGIEFSADWNDKVGSDFTYGIGARFSWGDNKVKRLDYAATNDLYPWMPHYGHSSDIGVWGYDYLGMFKNQDEINAYYAQYPVKQVFDTRINSVNDLKPGMMYFRDVRGPLQSDGTFAGPDGVIDTNDQIKLANRQGNMYGFGLTLKAAYKSISFNAVINGSFGGWSEIDARGYAIQSDLNRAYRSLPAIWGNIYDPTINPNGTMPNPAYNDMISKTSNFWRVSAFRMRMTNFNVAYSFPKTLVNKLGVANARIFVNGINPFNFYNPYTYRDADASWQSYPNLRTFSLGLNATF